MNTVPDISPLAALMANPARAAMLSTLLSGIALPAGALARCAKVSPSTASTHLNKLVGGGLLQVTRSGRHRYYRLNGAPVAELLETMALAAPPAQSRSLNQSLQNRALRRARTCYDHFAGRLGVTLTSALLARQWLEESDGTFRLTAAGEAWFRSLGIDCAFLRAGHRRFAAACLDWSERKPHLAGALGAALSQRLFDMGWVRRVDGSRAVKVTAVGCAHLQSELAIEWTEAEG